MIATVSNADEATILQKLHPTLRKRVPVYNSLCHCINDKVCITNCVNVYSVRIVDMSSTQNIVDVCLQETGGLGVNCIVDSGGIKLRNDGNTQCIYHCSGLKVV